MKALTLAAFLLCLAGSSSASHVGTVDPQAIVLDYRKFGVEIAIEKDEAGNLTSLKVTKEGKVFDVPKNELAGFGKDFRLSRARVLVGFATAGSPVTRASFDSFTISIPYGPVTINMAGDKEVHSLDEVRFNFKEGKLDERTRSISAGDDTSTWKLFRKVPGMPEQSGGEGKGPANVFSD